MVLGGAASVSGAWLGGLAMVFLPYYTAEWAGQIPLLRSLTDQPGLFANVIYGVVLIVFIYFVPSGLVPLLTRLRTRYLVIVPPEAAAVAAPSAARRRQPGSDTTPGAPDGGLAGPTPAIGGHLSPAGEHDPSDDPGQSARGLTHARGASQEERTR
jgi:branched-chain amino acid transport system permease protein